VSREIVVSETELAKQTLEEICRAGFDRATCQVSNDELHELQAENGEINLFRTNFETDIRLSGIRDQRRASLGVNKTDGTVIGEAISDLKAMSEGANADPAFDIATEQPAEIFSTGPDEPDYDLMYDRIREVQEYAGAEYPILNLRSVGITFFKRRSCMVNSNQVQFESTRGQYRVAISFSSKDGLDTSSMMYTGYSRFHLDDPLKDSVNVDTLFRQSTEQVRTQHLPGKFVGDLIIAPTCLSGFLGFLTARLGDGPMISGTSVYKDKLNEQVASDSLTLHSGPLSDEICSGYWVTGDGYKADNCTLIDKGKLNSYLLGLYGANKTGLDRAVNSGGCYIVEPGDKSFEEIVRQVDQGVLINRFSGGRPNDRGDFSGIAKNSYYIRDGKIQFPIRETTVSGNMIDLLQSIQSVSSERLNTGASVFPWVRVSGITAS
jgi:PmbA protein